MKHLGNLLLVIFLCLLLTACNTECIHEYQSEITQISSCTQEGMETFTCMHCQESYTQPIPILEHSYAPTYVEKEPTCVEEGIEIYTCTNCEATKSVSIEKLAHTFVDTTVTKEPNCTEEGECYGTCTACGTEQVIEKIPTNGVHVFANTVVREATCTDPGEGTNICTLCQHSEPCTYELKEHTYGNEKILANATCTKSGTKQLSCTNCGHAIEKTISAFGHKWANATCTTPGVCSVCNATGKLADHKYIIISDQKHYETFASVRKLQCSSCSKEKTEYYTNRHVVDLDAVNAAVGEYAKSLGYQISLNTYTEIEYRYAEAVIILNMYDSIAEQLITRAKACLDLTCSKYASWPGGLEARTAHIYAYYTESGALGGGYFGIYIDIT